jgi:hypothetical protein
MRRLLCLATLAALAVTTAALTASTAAIPEQGVSHALLDRILDTYVRDGYVYYPALKAERANLDRYVSGLDVAPGRLAAMSEDDRRAFWVNAYNALVLRTVINAYPIKGKPGDYPASSVAQISGGFDRTRHRVAGKVLTLDEIEKTVIAGFGDARFVFALGRGTVGSGRLRSEAYSGARLDAQLTEAVKEFVQRVANFKIDFQASTLTVTPLFSWREAQMVATFGAPGERWADRSALERAVVTMAFPHLFQRERDFLAQNTFRMAFGKYDWRLNDLTGRFPRD